MTPLITHYAFTVLAWAAGGSLILPAVGGKSFVLDTLILSAGGVSTAAGLTTSLIDVNFGSGHIQIIYGLPTGTLGFQQIFSASGMKILTPLGSNITVSIPANGAFTGGVLNAFIGAYAV